ncbi:MAG: chromate transporter [Bacteroidales bacterium]|nr:chromate transporter [Bacteroidales bacterium]
MIFFQLFYTFLIIGAFTFGGGYSMIALIQGEVVNHWGWMTAQEFTDLLAVSQMTPGPVGINTATYAGYTAVINAGYPVWAAVCGSLLASFSVIIIPVTLVMLVGGWLLRHTDSPRVASMMRVVRLAVVGLIAAAALGLFVDTFDVDALIRSHNLSTNQLVNLITSLFIFSTVFVLSWRYKKSPILLIVASGLMGLIVYSIC